MSRIVEIFNDALEGDITYFQFCTSEKNNKNLVLRHLLLETNTNVKMEKGKEQKGQEGGAAVGRSQRPVHEAQQYCCPQRAQDSKKSMISAYTWFFYLRGLGEKITHSLDDFLQRFSLFFVCILYSLFFFW